MNMRKYASSTHNISGVFVFLLLGIFAVLSTLMVLFCVQVYKGSVDRLAEHNTARIAPAYVRSMLRAGDKTGGVTVEDEAGVTAVVLHDDFDDESYLTRIYCYEGTLREWFSDADREFVPDEGEAVCACDGMDAEIVNGLLKVKLQEGDTATQVDISLRALR